MANQAEQLELAPADGSVPVKKNMAANPAAGGLAQLPAANDDATPVASPMPSPTLALNPNPQSRATQAGAALHDAVISPVVQSLGTVAGTVGNGVKDFGNAYVDGGKSVLGGIGDFSKAALGIAPPVPAQQPGTAATAQPTPAAGAIQQPITGQKSDDALSKVTPKMGGTLYPELDQQPAQSKATQQAGINGNVPKFDPNTMPELSLPDPRQSMSRLPTAVSGINPYSLESGMDVTGVTPTIFNALPALMAAKAGLAPYQNAVSQAKQARGEAVQDNKQGMELYNSMANRNLEAAKWARENQQNAWNATTGSFNAGLSLQKNNIEQQDVDNKLALGKLGLTKRFGVNVTDATGKKMVKIYDPATNSFVASAGAEADEQPEVKN